MFSQVLPSAWEPECQGWGPVSEPNPSQDSPRDLCEENRQHQDAILGGMLNAALALIQHGHLFLLIMPLVFFSWGLTPFKGQVFLTTALSKCFTNISLFIKFEVGAGFGEFLKLAEQMASASPADTPPRYMPASPLKCRKHSPVTLEEVGDESILLHSGTCSQLSGLGSVLREWIKSLPGSWAPASDGTIPAL